MLGNDVFVRFLDDEDTVKRKIMRSVTDDLGTVTFDMDRRPGIANLLNLYAAIHGTTPELAASVFEGTSVVVGTMGVVWEDSLEC